MVVIEKPTYGLIKLSILTFYQRIFTLQPFRYRSNIVILLVTLWSLAFFCGPENILKHALGKIHCVNSAQLLLWFAITDVVGDLVVLTMPYPCIRSLQMKRTKMLGLIGIFTLGILFVKKFLVLSLHTAGYANYILVH